MAEARYLPYGEERWSDGVAVTDFTFTSQRAERGFGLLDYRARFYHPGLGRFISADTVVLDPGNPQLFNRYSYAGNNPIRYNDPDGHCGPLCWIGIGVTLAFMATIPSSDVQPIQRGVCPYHQCEALDRYNTTVDYIHSEMVQNAQGPITNIIQGLDGASKKVAWGIMVAPNSFWDHKPKLRDMLGLYQEQQDFYFPIEGDLEYEYYYDVWSNIHYGYVGMAAGFDEETLQAGAAMVGLAGTNDAYDVLSIQIGVDLWQQYGLELTPEQIRDAILAHRDEYLRIWEEDYGGDDENFPPPPIPKRNGR